MTITKEKKQQLIGDFARHKTDTGSPDVQIAILSNRISHLTEHFRTHKKDHHSRHGLLKLVARRRKLLDYVKRTDNEKYQKLIGDLGIRR